MQIFYAKIKKPFGKKDILSYICGNLDIQRYYVLNTPKTLNSSLMKEALISMAIFFVALLTGCEKAVFEDATTSNDKSEQTNNKDIINKDTAKINYMTVAEAQEATVGDVICVRGYIVASCTRSMSNADFRPPFEGSTAIILADAKVDLDDFQYATDDDLFPICLTDYKDIRTALNLVDNPGLWNKQVFITGVKSRYMNLPGLKKVLQYQIIK